MEVLKKGNKKDFWSAVVKCTGEGNSYDNAKKKRSPCGSKLKINLQDIFVTSHTFLDASISEYFTIKCPCCGCLTDIEESIVPDSLHDYVYENEENELDY